MEDIKKEEKTLKISDMYSVAWDLIVSKKEAITWCLGILVASSVLMNQFTMNIARNTQQNFFLLIMGTLVFVWFSLYTLRLTYFCFRAKNSVTPRQLASQAAGTWKDYGRLLGAGLLTGLLYIGGLIWLLVPGIIVILATVFVPYIIVLEKQSIKDSVKKSYSLTYGYKSALLGQLYIPMIIVIVVCSFVFASIISQFASGSLTASLLQVIQQVVVTSISFFYSALLYVVYEKLNTIHHETKEADSWKKLMLVVGIIIAAGLLIVGLISVVSSLKNFKEGDTGNAQDVPVMQDGALDKIINNAPVDAKKDSAQ